MTEYLFRKAKVLEKCFCASLKSNNRPKKLLTSRFELRASDTATGILGKVGELYWGLKLVISEIYAGIC